MNKTMAIILVLFCFNIFIEAQSYKQIDISEEGELVAYVTPKEIYMVYEYEKKYYVINRNNLRYDIDGFLKLKFQGKDYLIIDGEIISQYFTEFKNDGENTYDASLEYFHDYNLLKIDSSSFYSETISDKLIKYTPDNLYKAFLIGCKCHPYWWNTSHIPWVEGSKGNGIGENVTIEFKKPIIGFSLLNGYVDINNLKLYKENSRIKSILISDLVNKTTQTVFIEDSVGFKFIKLERPAIAIKIIINEVYEGSKYQDTCISAIIDHQFYRDNIYRTETEIEKRLQQIIKNYKKINS